MKEVFGSAAATLIGTLFAVMALGCEKDQPKPLPAPPPAKEEPAAEEREPAPWFVGLWQGEVPLRALPASTLIDSLERRKSSKKKKAETPPEGASEVDEGQHLLRLSIDEARTVAGTIQLFGEEVAASGVLEDEILRVTLSGERANGTLVAKREGQDLVGQLRVSRVQSEKNQQKASASVGEARLTKGK